MEVFLYRALYFSLCLTFVEPTAIYQLFKGPKTGETQRYQVCPMLSQPCSHCFYCEDGVLSDSTYEYKQDVLCNQFYRGKNMSEALLPEELANNKIPVCNIGQVPGCGPPPQDNIQPGLSWKCDPGHSNQPHSVYFSCALICNYTNTVAYQYYCNESLRWELLEAANFSCISIVSDKIVTDASIDTTGSNVPVSTIVGCTVAGVGVIILVILISCLLHRKHRKDGKPRENEVVRNGNHAPNGSSNRNNWIRREHGTEIEMTVMPDTENIQAEPQDVHQPQDKHQTSVKMCDAIESSVPDTCSSEISLINKHDRRTNNDKPAEKCILKQIFNRKKNIESTSGINIQFKILKWQKCVDVNGVYVIPSGAEIRIFINPKQAKDLCVEKEAGPNIKGQYEIGKTQFVINPKKEKEDCSGKYCCKYTLLSSPEEKTELFEIQILWKKINNDWNRPDSNDAPLTLSSLVSKDSGLESCKDPHGHIPIDKVPKESDPFIVNWNSLSYEQSHQPNDLNNVMVECETTPCLTKGQNRSS
ncbi:uncharacterized protein LOC127879170 isoform X2 [Dreissena polymorpha]|uniref:uncharacterized protein LOC127879170 isoform X2 n=1 Tax=Dreissena polymorpha TaxID=45954 RepID=UPI002263E1E0|nr:uncharacterized protein LOC127879170 isoform X2 [Dreissena polymorpha]